MVVHDLHESHHEEPLPREQYAASPTVATTAPRPRSGGLVQSRVQFFEAPDSKRTTKQSLPPKVAVVQSSSRVVAAYAYESREAEHEQYQQHAMFLDQPRSAPYMPVSPPVSTVSRQDPRQQFLSAPLQAKQQQQLQHHHRSRYPDSFSDNDLNGLPAIDESRQEDFPVIRASSGRIGSPLLETGIQHYIQGEFVLAEKAFTTALKTQQANTPEDDLSTAIIMGNLGAVYLKQNRIEAAMKMLQASLNVKKSLGSKVMMADTYNNLGNCANLLGNYNESLEYYRMALQELRRKRGRKSDVADALFNIGRLEIHRKNFESANSILHEALRMAKEVYGKNHVYIAEASDLLGFVQVSLCQYELALVSFTKGLEVYRNLHGPLHPDVANAIFNIGMVRESFKEYPDAWEAYNTAQDLYRRLGTPPDDPGLRTVRRSIAHVEKLIAQVNQARLVEKHQEALLSKKKKKRGKRDRVSSGGGGDAALAPAPADS